MFLTSVLVRKTELRWVAYKNHNLASSLEITQTWKFTWITVCKTVKWCYIESRVKINWKLGSRLRAYISIELAHIVFIHDLWCLAFEVILEVLVIIGSTFKKCYVGNIVKLLQHHWNVHNMLHLRGLVKEMKCLLMLGLKMTISWKIYKLQHIAWY